MELTSGHATILRALVLVGLVVSIQVVLGADNKQAINNQPLASLNAAVRQLGSMDSKTMANVTSALEQVANNMRKMLEDNARIQSDVKNFLLAVQNTTGVNMTAAANNLRTQSLNTASLSSLLPRASRSTL